MRDDSPKPSNLAGSLHRARYLALPTPSRLCSLKTTSCIAISVQARTPTPAPLMCPAFCQEVCFRPPFCRRYAQAQIRMRVFALMPHQEFLCCEANNYPIAFNLSPAYRCGV